MLSRIQVNPVSQEVGILGGGEVQLRINGVKVVKNDVLALKPSDIIRVEYHDNPGLRYGNAAAVIDYIVRRHETGGNLGVNLRNSFLLKRWGNNAVNGRINHKKSEFAVNYSIAQRDFDDIWRDNEETFRFADGTVIRRKEVGEPGRFQRYWQELNATYSYLNENRMFNATFRYYADNTAHFDNIGKLYNMEAPDDFVQVFDGQKDLTSRPAIDLYYQENLKNDRTLVVNLVGTYNNTDNNRIYTESREDDLLTDINNSVAGEKYSWIGEAIYERKLGDNRLSAGLRHTQAYTDNIYRNSHENNTEMQQSETYLYSEWKGKVKKLDYTLGLGLTRSYFEQKNDGTNYETYTFNPRLSLFHPLSGNSSVRLTARINNSMPSLSELSAVEQTIDSIQIQRGNPNLKSYVRYQTELNYEWKKGLFYANLQGKYHYFPSAVMEEKFLEDNKIVQTWNNQKNMQYANANLSLRIGPVKNIVTLMLEGGLNHYVSNGNNYRHVYNNPFLHAIMSANYKNFQGNLIWEFFPENNFSGETMQGGERIHLLLVGYKYKDMNFGVGAINPFANDYRQDSENMSAFASYKRSLYSNDISKMYFFTFSYNFSFGRKFDSGQKRLSNSDDDSGVMKAGK
jgi:hypothetical protein